MLIEKLKLLLLQHFFFFRMPFLRNKSSFSKKLVSKKRFSYNYKWFFFVRIFFENAVFFERTAFERKTKMKKIRKNGFRKTFFNFERTLFNQTTSSRIFSFAPLWTWQNFPFQNYFSQMGNQPYDKVPWANTSFSLSWKKLFYESLNVIIVNAIQ